MQNISGKTAHLCKLGKEFLTRQRSCLLAGGIIQARAFASNQGPKKKRNYYDVLALSPKATQSHIKASYYNLSKVYHPDVNKSKEAAAMFSAISEAYETLGNVKKRRLYDRGFLNPSGTRGHYNETSSGSATYGEAHGFRERTRTAPRGRTSIYDFDEFYRRHYEESMQQKESNKDFKIKTEQERQNIKADQARGIFCIGLALGIILAALPFTSNRRRTKHDS